MSINDSIGNGTIGSTAPAEGTAEPGVSQGVGIDQEQPAKGSSAFATRANKSSSEGLSKGKLLLLGSGLQSRFSSSLLRQSQAMRPRNRLRQSHRHSNRNRPKRSRPKAALRLLWTLCVPPRRTIRPANLAQATSGGHAHRRVRMCPNRVQTQRRSRLRESREPGARWRACRRSSRHNRSGKILRLTAKRQTSQLCRTSSRTH